MSRRQMTEHRPETTIALAALFISVAGLARTIGGVAAAITAAALGVAVAALVAAPLMPMLRRRRTRDRESVDGASVFMLSAIVITALTLAGLFVYEAVRIEREERTKDAIRTAILKSYDAELSWYKAPATDKTALLERWFVPVAKGGERLSIIEAAVARLRRCARRIGAAAATTTTTFVSSIDVSGSEAKARAVQSLYQPILDFRDGEWVPRQLRPQDLSFSVPDQLYLLKRVDGRWLVQSAPQSQNLGPC